MLVEPNKTSDEQLTRAVLRLSGNIVGLSLGLLCGLLVCAATLCLVIKGGEHVGQHLQLLSQFYYGYTVTYTGSLIGLLYGFGTGYLAGRVIAWIYNRVVAWKNH